MALKADGRSPPCPGSPATASVLSHECRVSVVLLASRRWAAVGPPPPHVSRAGAQQPRPPGAHKYQQVILGRLRHAQEPD